MSEAEAQPAVEAIPHVRKPPARAWQFGKSVRVRLAKRLRKHPELAVHGIGPYSPVSAIT